MTDKEGFGSIAGGRVPVLFAAIVAALTFLVYLPSLGSGFLNWDDHIYVTSNPYFLRDGTLAPGFFRAILVEVFSGNWHPLTMLSHGLDFSVYGYSARGHHLTNNILHAINSALVMLVAYRLFIFFGRKDGEGGVDGGGALVAALFTALVFGLHPAHVESVSWISERKDLLCALFYLLSVLFYLSYSAASKSSRGRFYIFSLITFALALLSKPMAVSLPVVLLILDYSPLARLSGSLKSRLVEKIPFIALTIGSCLATLWAQRSWGAVGSLKSFPLSERLLNAISSYAFYLKKLFLPVGLAPYYPHPAQSGGEGFMTAGFFVSIAIFAAVTILALLWLKKRPWFSAAWSYYLITLLPVIGIVQVGAQAAADRYTYLPSLSVLILAGALLIRLTQTLDERKATAVRALFIAVLSIVYIYSSTAQQGVWKSSYSLWDRQISVYPERVALAYNNRGIALGRMGKLRSARDDFDTALRIDPTHIKSYFNRANTYSLMGLDTAAVEDLSTAIKVAPRYVNAYIKRGELLYNMGRLREAAGDLERALELQPTMADVYLSLVRIYRSLGDMQRVKYNLNKAAALGSKDAELALMNMEKK